MATHTGPKGGVYKIVNGRKVYLQNDFPLRGRGAYKRGSRRKLRGRGAYGMADYKRDSKRSAIGGALGTAAGGLLGSVIPGLGTGVGASIGGALGSLLGFGDYQSKIKKNVFVKGLDVAGVTATGPAKMANFSDEVIITKREYVGEISGSEDFANTDFDINPGNAALFPWLSRIAPNYEQYTWEGLIFEYRPTSVDALDSANTAIGSVMLTTDYNVENDKYSSKMQFLQNEATVSVKPSCGVMHPVECARAKTQVPILNVRTAEVSTGDKRLYDIGKFQIATDGQQSGTTNVLGELWVTYQCRFRKSTMSVADSELVAYYELNGTESGNPLGTSPPSVVYDNIGLTVGLPNATVSTIIVPAEVGGLFEVCLQWSGSAATTVFPSFSLQSAGNLFWTDVTSDYSAVASGNFGTAAAGQTVMCMRKFILIDPQEYFPGGTMTVGFVGTLPAEVSSAIFQMRQWPIPPSSSSMLLTKPKLAPLADEKEMSSFEKSFREFMRAPANQKLTSEERIALFDRLHPVQEEDDEKETKESFVKVVEPTLQSLSTSQLLEAAVKKAKTNAGIS